MYKDIIKLAVDAKENSYSPYSKFRVGAAVETEEGLYYTGCNIENAAFTPTVCAERVAIFKAISEGKKIKRIAVSGDTKAYPCGVCRQVMREFNPEMEVIIVVDNENYEKYFLKDFLPLSFGPENLAEDIDV
ncbi:MAG: cytidine deaminase [Tissierellia bacterium]|nr:cytidine deaminase [Tissierellia bacterium]